MTSNDTVISGISGKFPECHNVEDFRKALYDGLEIITTDKRFPLGMWGLPKRSGTIPDLEKFDATFFGIPPRQAEVTEPRHRLLLESVYECIVDAGYNPAELRGTKTGVYVGLVSFVNYQENNLSGNEGYSETGSVSSIAANRISFCFDFKGPSFSIDTACSSSMYALAEAFAALQAGYIDYAVVCGANLLLHPVQTLALQQLGALSSKGHNKSFCVDRDGYVRSEAVVSIFLQKENGSRRIYAKILGALSNSDGYKEEGLTFPSALGQVQLMNDVYCKNKVNPDEVTYTELHATGTVAGDIEECKAVANYYCLNRTKPLFVGSVKANIGHTEAASGLCSIVKVLLMMESGVIPANIYSNIDQNLAGIRDNKLQVVTRNTPWCGGVAAVNSFGFGGANSHVILKPFNKSKSKTYDRPKHRLVVVSGRTPEAVNHLLDGVVANQDDAEFLALIDQIHRNNIDRHMYRGYVVLGDDKERNVERFTNKRPVWFIYAGLGSQWPMMGRDLLKFEVFKETFVRCAIALEPYDVNLYDIVTNPSPQIFDDDIHLFCGIAAVEIALTDLLTSIGIQPDGFAGHSMGEIGCGYANGDISAEQAVLLSYARACALKNANDKPGAMAAVGLAPEICQNMLPSDIFIACRNNMSSVTVSGPENSVLQFVEELTSKGIFARHIKGIQHALHSIYIKDAGPFMYDFIKNVIKDPQKRSSKWKSSSVSPERANEAWANFNGAEYHTNNLLQPVLFNQVYEHIPSDAIVIEVAPHGLLQAILKREFGPNVTNISLVDKTSPDNEHFLLTALGKFYVAGGQPDLRKLYPNVTFPVSRGTTMISPLIKWEHNMNWFVPIWKNKEFFGELVTLNLFDEEYAYLSDYVVDGKVHIPVATYLAMVWNTASKKLLKNINEVLVIIENVRILRNVTFTSNEELKFIVNITHKSGNFEIILAENVIVHGTISVPQNIESIYTYPHLLKASTNANRSMIRGDIYRELRLRGYKHEEDFRGLLECDLNGEQGKLEWKNKFDCFLDSMLHLQIIRKSNRNLELPFFIERVVVDPIQHLRHSAVSKDFSILHDPMLNSISSGGIEITGVEWKRIARQEVHPDPELNTYDFVPYESPENDQLSFETSLYISLQIIVENIPGAVKRIKICEVLEQGAEEFSSRIVETLCHLPLVDADFIKQNPRNIKDQHDVVVIAEHVSQLIPALLAQHLTINGFVLYFGDISKLDQHKLQIIYGSATSKGGIYLLRPDIAIVDYPAVSVYTSNLKWIEELQQLSKKPDTKQIYIISQNDKYSGVMGLVRCLLAEPSQTTYTAVFIDQEAEEFSIEKAFYKKQLKKGLNFNVLRNDQWGTLCRIPYQKRLYVKTENAGIAVLTPGDLTSVNWIQTPETKPDPKTENVRVVYASINYVDVTVGSGILHASADDAAHPHDIFLGVEYAGITKSSRRVMGIKRFGALSPQIETDPVLTWEIPKCYTLEEACSLPSIYIMLYYVVKIRAQIYGGETILIHYGYSPLGIAAISLLLHMKCTPFVIVSNADHQRLLKEIFPELPIDNIVSKVQFDSAILEKTNGRGVDVVLYSIYEDLFQTSLRCLAKQGKFLILGTIDEKYNNLLGCQLLNKGYTYQKIAFLDLFKEGEEVWRKLQELVEHDLNSDVLKPLPRKVFTDTQLEEAFRVSAVERTKVLVKLSEEANVYNTPAKCVSALPRLYFHPNKSYIIVGGLGGLGLELARWLIKKGAKKLVLNSRKPPTTGYQNYSLNTYSKVKGVIIKTSTNNTLTYEGAKELILQANELGPVGGIFNAAVVLQDGLFSEQTVDSFEKVLNAKITSALNLDEISRELCPELDHFVAFSSISSGIGAAGVSNYGMANSCVESLCEKRRLEGLPALAIQFGYLADVGVVADLDLGLYLSYFCCQNVASCLEQIEQFMLQSKTVCSSYILANRNISVKSATKTPAQDIAQILRIKQLDSVDKKMTLTELGLDSLMLSEVQKTLSRNHQIELDVKEIRQLTFENIFNL